MKRSQNCQLYTDHAGLLVTATASVPGKDGKCEINLPSYVSCQQEIMERPDETTATQMRSDAARLLKATGCIRQDDDPFELQFSTLHLGVREPEMSAQEMSQRGAVSSCYKVGHDVNEIPFLGEARCFPTTAMERIADGKMVTSFHMPVTAQLGVCAVDDDSMLQTAEDLRKVAAHNLELRGYRIDPQELECPHISVLPRM